MPAPSSPHAGHDVLVLAAAADHDPDPATVALVERMTAECAECAAIAADLRFLAGGLATLPPEVAAPRDFRITDVQAERLRRGGFLRRLLLPFGVDGLPGMKPLASALTVVGLAGILLTNLPISLLPSAGSAAAPLNEDRNAAGGGTYSAAGPSSVPAEVAVSGAPNQGPGTKTDSPQPSAAGVAPPQTGGVDTAGQGSAAPVGPLTNQDNNVPGVARDPTGFKPPAIPPVTLASIVVLLLGVLLLSLRAVARRID